jgi:integrase
MADSRFATICNHVTTPGGFMKGTITKRISTSGTTTWGFGIDAGKDENGRRLRIWRTNFTRRKDAEAELTRLLQEREDGLLVKPIPKTFGEFMSEWFTEHAERHCSAKTVERYRQLWKYVSSKLAHIQLREMNPLTLERLYNRLVEAGGKDGAPLSPKTVRHVAGLLHVALGTAVRWRLLKINPATACQLPRVERTEAKALDPTQAEWLLSAAQGHWLRPIIALAMATGCRRGELLALVWPDVDFDSTPAVITISKSVEQTKAGLRIKRPKNGKTRAFPLPASAKEILRTHREEQEQHRFIWCGLPDCPGPRFRRP